MIFPPLRRMLSRLSDWPIRESEIHDKIKLLLLNLDHHSAAESAMILPLGLEYAFKGQ